MNLREPDINPQDRREPAPRPRPPPLRQLLQEGLEEGPRPPRKLAGKSAIHDDVRKIF